MEEDLISATSIVFVEIPSGSVTLEIPEIVLNDPTAFYKVEKGLGLWDASHALAVALPSLLLHHEKTTSSSAERSTADHTAVNTLLDSGTDEQPSLSGVRVIELGAGVAALGAVCAATLGCEDVVASDYPDQVMQACQRTVEKNELEIAVKKVDFTEPVPQELARRFDIVCASDVVYNASDTRKLSVTVDALLDPESPHQLFACSRKVRLPQMENVFFEEYLPELGFTRLASVIDDPLERYRRFGRCAFDAEVTSKIEVSLYKRELKKSAASDKTAQ